MKKSILNTSVNVFGNLGAIWLVCVAVTMCVDVVGRGVFATPIPGVEDIVANSIVAILFLQIPLSVFDNAMIRATLVYDTFGVTGRKIIDSLVCIVGMILFVSIVFGAFPDMVIGWEILETEGSGALEVPVYPTRTVIVTMSAITAFVYGAVLYKIWFDKRDTYG